MARKREIHPGFFKNEDMSELNPLCRLFFIGMLTIADKDGRLEDRPKKIKAEILPYDNCDGEEFADALTERGFLIRYEVDGQRFIQINNWTKYQSPHPKETPSKIPAPMQEESKVNPGYTQEQPEENLASTEGCSFNPIPSFTSIPSYTSLNTTTTTTGNNAREEKLTTVGKEESPPAEGGNQEVAHIFTLYQNNVHPVVSQIEADNLADMIQTYSPLWVERAITEAVMNGVRKLNYIQSILQRWSTSGVAEPWTQKREVVPPTPLPRKNARDKPGAHTAQSKLDRISRLTEGAS